MRLFRRAQDTKTSVLRREGLTGAADAAPPASVSLVETSRPFPAEPPPPPSSAERAVEQEDPRPQHEGDSDVFVCTQGSKGEAARTAREVTLFVHEWHNVEPGLLSWTFPSLRAALDAVQRMKNAIGWCVVSGSGWATLDAARASGAVLVEQLA